MSRILAVSSAMAVWSSSSVAGQPRPQTLDNAIEVEPLRVASIGEDFRLTSDWYDYGAIAGTGCSTGLSWDAFDPNSTGFPAHGEDCNPNFEGSTRWFFGTSHCNMFSTNDAVIGTLCSDRFEAAWYWTCAGQAAQHCFVLLQVYEKFDQTCEGPDRNGFLDGVVVDLGPLDCNTGAYFFVDVDLCLAGIEIAHPVDRFAYDLILAQAYDSSSGVVTLADCAQPMLWGTDGHSDPDLDGPGTQTAIQWDDTNPADGTHTPIDECYDYTFGLCPDPLSSMFCMFSPACEGPGECITLTVPTLVSGSPATFTGWTSRPDTTVALLYAFGTQSGVYGQTGNFCAESQLMPPLGDGIVFMTTSDGAGDYEFTVDVPRAARGLTVNFQAFGEICPIVCDSDVVTRFVL